MITWICSAVSDPDDQEFLIELYEEFHALMFSVARRYNNNWMSCEDIVQESILRIMDKLDVLRSKKRCVQAGYIAMVVRNVAINTLKHEDKPFDNHSSKNISIPLNPGLLLTVLNDKPITAGTKTIRLKVQAEEGFHPQTDMDISSLRFGASEEVNYGRGSKVLKTENDGNDLIITFDGKGNGITEKEFAPKLIGRYKNGKMLYGYARLPYVDYVEPILSARAPVFSESQKGWNGNIEVQNFGQVSSQKASVKIEYKKEGKMVKVASAAVPALKPYEKADIRFATKADFEKGEDYNFLVTIYSGKKVLSTFRLNRKVVE